MKKIFIAALFLLMSLSVQAQIAYNPYASLGATSAVDFARITEGYFPEGNIIFYVGELTFNATISNTKPPYSANELSKIIKEVMNDLGVTEGMLEGINNDLAERDQITAQQWHDLALKALDIVGSSDLNPVADVYKYGRDKINAARQGQTLEQMFQGDDVRLVENLMGQGMDQLQDEVTSQLTSHLSPTQMARYSAAKKAGGWLMIMKAAVELGWNLGDFMNQYHLWDRQEYLDRMMERQLAKELFYDACKQRVTDELERYYADGQWEIKVQDGIRRSDAKLFGTAITQIWFLEGQLVKVENAAATGKYALRNASWKGRYEGPMKLTASHADLGGFDKSYKQNVILSKWLPFRTLKSLFSCDDHTLVNVALGDKVLETPKLALVIRETQGQRLARFIGQMEEKPVSFTSQHRGDFLLQHVLWHDGKLDAPWTHGELNMKFTFTSGVEGDYGRMLCLYMQQQKNTNITKIRAPRLSLTYDFTSTMPNFAVKGPVRFMVDNTLFTSLEKDCGYIIEPKPVDVPAGSPKPSNQGPKRNAATDNAPLRVSAPGESTPPAINETYDWWADFPEEVREPIERGNACVANGHLPEEYDWLMPDGLQEDDFVSLSDKALTLSFDERDGATFQQLVQRAKAHGYELPADDDAGDTTGMGYYEGVNADGKQCSIIYSSHNKYLTIEIGEPEQMTIDPSQVTPEIDLSDIPELQGIPTMSPKMKQLQKRMTELAQELQAHPERSAKIQKEMQRLGEEMAREAEKMQK